MKATFTQRLFAYIIDFIIVGLVCSIIASFLPVTSKEKELNEELKQVSDKFYENKTPSIKTMEIYLRDTGKITYEKSKITYVEGLMTFAIYIGYFVFFQYQNGGRTLGKKFMRIKIDNNGKDPSLKDVIYREAFIQSLFPMALEMVCILIMMWNVYWIFMLIFEGVFLLLIVISAFMVLFRKDKLALHDMFTKTTVIVEN